MPRRKGAAANKKRGTTLKATLRKKPASERRPARTAASGFADDWRGEKDIDGPRTTNGVDRYTPVEPPRSGFATGPAASKRARACKPWGEVGQAARAKRARAALEAVTALDPAGAVASTPGTGRGADTRAVLGLVSGSGDQPPQFFIQSAPGARLERVTKGQSSPTADLMAEMLTSGDGSELRDRVRVRETRLSRSQVAKNTGAAALNVNSSQRQTGEILVASDSSVSPHAARQAQRSLISEGLKMFHISDSLYADLRKEGIDVGGRELGPAASSFFPALFPTPIHSHASSPFAPDPRHVPVLRRRRHHRAR